MLFPNPNLRRKRRYTRIRGHSTKSYKNLRRSSENLVSRFARNKRPKVLKPFFSFKKFIILFFLIVLISGLFYFVFLSGIFEVKNIILVNNRSISLQEVEKTITPAYKKNFLGLQFNNILFFDIKEAELLLLQNYSRLSSVKITKKLPDTLEIEVQEREGGLVWETGDKRYLIDIEGVVFSECLGESNLPKVIDSKKLPVVLNSQIVSSDFVNFVLGLTDKLPKEGISIVSITVPESTYDLWVKTKEGFDIYFDVTRNLDPQLAKLKVLLKEIGGERNYIQYIDLRIENKIFYK
jgi:cell division septal protein FtsQ